MATAIKFNVFVLDLAQKKHDFSADTFKVALSNVAPVATNAVFADITEIAAGNGYSAGGGTATLVSSTQTSGTYTVKFNNVTTTASGGVGPFRYAVFYNFSQASPVKPLCFAWDYGSSQSLTNGDTFTVSFDSVNGVAQIT
jgi:hypothetical protein